MSVGNHFCTKLTTLIRRFRYFVISFPPIYFVSSISLKHKESNANEYSFKPPSLAIMIPEKTIHALNEAFDKCCLAVLGPLPSLPKNRFAVHKYANRCKLNSVSRGHEWMGQPMYITPTSWWFSITSTVYHVACSRSLANDGLHCIGK